MVVTAVAEVARIQAAVVALTVVEAVSFRIWNSRYKKIVSKTREKEVALATSLCYYLPHENKCKRQANTFRMDRKSQIENIIERGTKEA